MSVEVASEQVSPGLMPRPSLSGRLPRSAPKEPRGRVAGVDAPAFVERSAVPRESPTSKRGVAGVDAPAFVERGLIRGIQQPPRSCRRG